MAKRKFYALVKFNISDAKVKRTLDIDFDYTNTRTEVDGTRRIWYTGNAKSSEQSVMKGTKKYLDGWDCFKDNYEIITVKEVTEPVDRFYFQTDSSCPDSICDDYFGTLEEAVAIAQRVANEEKEPVIINSCTTEDIEDIVDPDEPEESAETDTKEAEKAVEEATNSESVRKLMQECAPLETVMKELTKILEASQQKGRPPPRYTMRN